MYTDKFLADSYKQNLQSSTHAEYSLTILVKCEHWFWDLKSFPSFSFTRRQGCLADILSGWRPANWVQSVPISNDYCLLC